jgi:hypothetical protein
MATVFENIPLNGIRTADLRVLHELILSRKEEGSYYGNQAKYYERLDRLDEWIRDATSYAYSDGVKMPKTLPSENPQAKRRG